MMLGIARFGLWIAPVALALVASPRLSAQDSTTDHNHLYDKFQVRVAFTTVLNNSTARLDAANGGVGTDPRFPGRSSAFRATTVQPAIGIRLEAGPAYGIRSRVSVHQPKSATGQPTRPSSSARTRYPAISTHQVQGQLRAPPPSSSSTRSWPGRSTTSDLALGLGAIFFDITFDATATPAAGRTASPTPLSTTREASPDRPPRSAPSATGGWAIAGTWAPTPGASARGWTGTISRSFRRIRLRASTTCRTGGG